MASLPHQCQLHYKLISLQLWVLRSALNSSNQSHNWSFRRWINNDRHCNMNKRNCKSNHINNHNHTTAAASSWTWQWTPSRGTAGRKRWSAHRGTSQHIRYCCPSWSWCQERASLNYLSRFPAFRNLTSHKKKPTDQPTHYINQTNQPNQSAIAIPPMNKSKRRQHSAWDQRTCPRLQSSLVGSPSISTECFPTEILLSAFGETMGLWSVPPIKAALTPAKRDPLECLHWRYSHHLPSIEESRTHTHTTSANRTDEVRFHHLPPQIGIDSEAKYPVPGPAPRLHRSLSPCTKKIKSLHKEIKRLLTHHQAQVPIKIRI